MLDKLRINIIQASINKLDTKNKIIYDTLNNSYSYDKLVMPYRSNRETEIEIEIMIPSYQEVRYVF